MREPPGLPARIRTDASNPFAQHTMAVRVPAILDEVLSKNPDLPPPSAQQVAALRDALRADAPLPALPANAPHTAEWLATLPSRAGASWGQCDWFFAENYAYRCLAEAVDFWQRGRDPFQPIKREEYASAGHRAALEGAARIGGDRDDQLQQLLLASVFGNRMDLSFAASRERGVTAAGADLLIDDRAAALELLGARFGPVHLVIDNAGTELSVDLVLAARLLEQLSAPLVLHVKLHPCFVSDAIAADVRWFIEAEASDARSLWSGFSPEADACRERLRSALASGQLEIAPHAFWNGPRSLWECPPELERRFSGARLVILKGDAHYRRAVGDALWAPERPFAAVTGYFPAPLLALRTLKSDPIVGLRPGLAEELDSVDARWRVNGQRAVACLGGQLR
jgi:uncharacterized protein with ATP-grasp and redox domains